MTTGELALEFKGVSKRFGRVTANDQVSFAVRKGTIHALVGENGAGKSTLMKMLFGLYHPDHGTIEVFGKSQTINNPAHARALGIGMVHQHFMLANPISALDHVVLDSGMNSGSLAAVTSPLDRARLQNELEQLALTLTMPVPWEEPIEALPVGIQQRIEILKLLYNRSELLILDEPTAVLTPQEVDDFLQRLKDIRSQGKTIVLITHKLKEVFAVADDITVLRRGRSVRSAPLQQWTYQQLTEEMIGEHFHELQVQSSPTLDSQKIVLNYSNSKCNFSIAAGEIVGLAGVEGNGQSELIRSLINPKIHLEDTTAEILTTSLVGKTTLQVRQLGVGYLPEDRHAMAISLASTIWENFLLGQQSSFGRLGFIQLSDLHGVINRALKEYSVKYDSADQLMSELSGGNQQKLVVARELLQPLNLLLACHPTRGVDINSIQRIHQALVQIRDHGTGVLLVSSELDELMKLSDRILVMYRSQIVKSFSRHEFDERKIGSAMAGVIS